MKNSYGRNWIRPISVMMTLIAGNVLAMGGLVELPGNFGDSSNDITNPWWPQVPGSRSVYIEEADDECIVGVADVISTISQSRTTVNGVKVREIWDREFIDTVGDCDADTSDIGDWTLLETTYDWYAQDVDGNVWYFGEFTVALEDHDDCEHTIDASEGPFFEDGCRDGSWEAGYDIWAEEDDGEILAGIIMLASPHKGQFYFQEFWEDEATDMGKVLNFKNIDTVFYGAQEGCVVIKEWVPLDPGNVEHKYYCQGHGLLLVAGLAGGKTVYADLVDYIDP